MKEFIFKDKEEFEELFSKSTPEVTGYIMIAIKEAIDSKTKTAKLFNIGFTDVEESLDITLPKSQWAKAIEECTDLYRKWDMPDQAIDSFMLGKKLKG